MNAAVVTVKRKEAVVVVMATLKICNIYGNLFLFIFFVCSVIALEKYTAGIKNVQAYIALTKQKLNTHSCSRVRRCLNGYN